MAEEFANMEMGADGVDPSAYNVDLTNPAVAMAIASGQAPAPAPKVIPKNDYAQAFQASNDKIMYDVFSAGVPQTALEKLNAPVGPKTSYAGPDIDIYRYQENFESRGFNPFDPANYERWTEREDWGSALGKGFDSFGTRFGNTFSDYWKDYGRMFDALVNWDSSLLQPDEDQMLTLDYEEHKESMKNYVFIPPDQDDDIFSKRSVSEFIGNAGFALGTFAGFGIELVADALITIGTAGGGIGTFGATIGRFGAKMGLKTGVKTAVKAGAKEAAEQGIKQFGFRAAINDMAKGYTMADNSADALRGSAKIKQAEELANATKIGGVKDSLKAQLKEVWEVYSLNIGNIMKSRSFGDFALQAGKALPVVGTGVRYGEKIAVGAKGGLSAFTLAGIGARGFRRMAQEFNMSSTEAAFEGISTYGDTLDKMVNQYRADHDGENPPPEELAKMQDLATKASFSNYQTNFAILAATNKMQFGSLFNKFSASNVWMKEILQEGAEKTLGVNRVFKSAVTNAKLYEKGFFGTYGLTGQIAKDFGKKQAAYELGKTFMKDFGRFEILEGLQENIQESSNSAWKNYYAGLYNGTKYTLLEAFGEGLGEQWSKQGLKTFLQGALTGSMIRIPSALGSKTIEFAQKKAMDAQYKSDPSQNPFTKAEAQRKQDINLVNDLLQQMGSKKFKETIINFNTQANASVKMSEAAAKNNEYEWMNAKDNSVLAGALAANRLGMTGVYTAAIREMGKEMTNEDFKAQFGVDIADTKHATASEFADKMAKDVAKYSDMIDKVRKKAKNLVDPLMYEMGSKERMVATMLYNAQEEAVRIIALNQMKAMRASERAETISKEIMGIQSLANSSEYILRVMTNPESFRGETGNIMAEIKILEESLKQEGIDAKTKANTNERIKLKNQELDLLQKWESFWSTRDVLIEREDAEGKKVSLKKTVPDTFVGKSIKGKIVETNYEGEEVAEHDTEYDLYNDEVVQVFKDLVNLRNKQAGINTEISEADARDAVKKIVDFTRLDQDAKDYMKSVDALFNPKYYQQTLERIADGEFKADLLEFIHTIDLRITSLGLKLGINTGMLDAQELFKIVTEITEAVRESDGYKNLIVLAVDEKLGYQHWKVATDAIKDVEKVLAAKIAEIEARLNPGSVEDISDDEYAQFKKDGTVSDVTKMTIARKIFNEEDLGKRQQEVYEAFKDEIDAIVNELLQNIKDKRKQRPGKRYDTPPSARMPSQKELLMKKNDDRMSEDIIEYYGFEDGKVVPLKQIVELAIENPFVHPLVKEGLKGFLPFISSGQTFKMNLNMTWAPGTYNGTLDQIEVDPSLADSGQPWEAVLLHELVHAMTSRELYYSPDGFFATEVKRLYEQTVQTLEAQGIEVFDEEGREILYGFKNVHEFLAEAYSSPALQKMLQSVPSEGGRSTWDNFVQALFEFLKKAFNIKMQRSVLDDLFQLVENHINNSPAAYAQQKLIESGMSPADFTELAMTPNEIVDLALREGVVTLDELRNLKSKDQDTIPDDVYDAFVETGDVAPEIIQDIAEKIANGEKLSSREESIRQAKSTDVEEALQNLKAGDPALNAEGLPNYTVEEIEGEGFTAVVGDDYLLKQPDGTPMMFQTIDDLHAHIERQYNTTETKTGSEKADDVNDTPDQTDVIANSLGISVKNLQETPTEKEQTPPFSIEGDENSGYTVVTKDGTKFPEQFATREAAEEFLNSILDTRTDVEFGMEFMGDLAEFEEPAHLLDRFVTRARQSMTRFNKANNTAFETIEEYAATPEGADALDMIKESVLTNLPLEKVKQRRKKEKKERESLNQQPTLFDTTSSITSTGPAVAMTNLEKLRNIALESLGKTAPAEQAEQLEKTEKMTKFVEGVPSSKVTDQDIYNDLRNILGCS